MDEVHIFSSRAPPGPVQGSYCEEGSSAATDCPSGTWSSANTGGKAGCTVDNYYDKKLCGGVGSCKGWAVKVYNVPSSTTWLANPAATSLVGSGATAALAGVDLKQVADWKAVIAAAPSTDFMWRIFGTVNIATRGKYKVCIVSAGSSKLYVQAGDCSQGTCTKAAPTGLSDYTLLLIDNNNRLKPREVGPAFLSRATPQIGSIVGLGSCSPSPLRIRCGKCRGMLLTLGCLCRPAL
jgi:hypothetical protein